MQPVLDDLTGDPHPHLARLRGVSPVAWVDALGGWLVTGRDAAVEVLRDAATFTVDDPRFSTARVVGASMLSTDGAEHVRHRTPYAPVFRPRRVTTDFGPFVAAEATRLVGVIDGPTDLRTALAGPLAAATVAATLGMDGGDQDVVRRLLDWYREIVGSVSGIAAGQPPSTAGASAMVALGDAVRDHVAGHGELSDAETVSNAAVIMFGGIETTEGMILNALWFLLGDDDARRAVVADPGLAAGAVEESLRMEPAAAVVDRYATIDTTLAGSPIASGDLVVVSLAGANRDPAAFVDPDRYDLHRADAARHLAFAAGPHVCLGMDLARLEARVAVQALLARFPAVQLAAGAPSPTGLVFRKPATMPVLCHPGT